MTCNQLDKEGNAGQWIIVTGWNGERRKKPNDWPNAIFFVSGSLERKFSSGQTLTRDRRQFSQALGKSPVKKVEQNLWTEDRRKAHSARFWGCNSPVKKDPENKALSKISTT